MMLVRSHLRLLSGNSVKAPRPPEGGVNKSPSGDLGAENGGLKGN
jgi:hypothetical protein